MPPRLFVLRKLCRCKLGSPGAEGSTAVRKKDREDTNVCVHLLCTCIRVLPVTNQICSEHGKANQQERSDEILLCSPHALPQILVNLCRDHVFAMEMSTFKKMLASVRVAYNPLGSISARKPYTKYGLIVQGD